MPRQQGQPPSFSNATLRVKALEMAERGFPLRLVLTALGVTRQAHNMWVHRADPTDPRYDARYAAWVAELDAAMARGKLALLNNIREAGEGYIDRNGELSSDWKASAWILERTAPAEFGKHVVQTIEDKRPATTRLDVSKLSNQELEVLYALVAKAQPDVVDVASVETTPQLESGDD